MYLGKIVLKISSKFTEEHPCRSAISIKSQSNFTESHFGMGVSFKFAAYFQNTCFLEHPWMPASVYNELYSYPVNNNDHINQLFNKDRSSYWRCSVRKVVLRHFANFTEKHLCQSLSFNKVAGLRPATLLKKRLWHSCFLWILRNFYKHLFYTTPLEDCFCKEISFCLLRTKYMSFDSFFF